jgi:hypothetical protein
MDNFVSAKELWEACERNDLDEIRRFVGIPEWRKDCDGMVYELGWGRTAYRHRDGFRWPDGKWFTKKECRKYDVTPGIMNI